MVERKVTKTRYTSGRATIANIIRAAERVLAEQGHAALSLRRVAQECGLPTGNVSYYISCQAAIDQGDARFHRCRFGGPDGRTRTMGSRPPERWAR